MEMVSTRAHRRRRSGARSWPRWLGRAGLVGRGCLYVVIGWLALTLAAGRPAAETDQRGALEAVAAQPAGRLLVLGLAVLLAAYGAHRLVLAARNPEGDGVAKRAWLAWRGVFYAALTWIAIDLAAGGPTTSGSDGKEHELSARVMAWPAGRWVVAAVGLGVIAVGCWQAMRVATGAFAKDLARDEMPAAVERAVRAVGVAGTLSRMVAFLLAGSFVVRAAVEFDPSEPIGLDESLARAREASLGPPALVVVGLGLACYGAFVVARARYQRMSGA